MPEIIIAMPRPTGKRSMSGHLSKIFGSVIVPNLLECKRNPSVLAIAVIGCRSTMHAVGDASLVDERPKKLVRPLHCQVNFRMLDTKLLSQSNQKEAPISSGIQGTIAGVHTVQLATIECRPGKRVSP